VIGLSMSVGGCNREPRNQAALPPAPAREEAKSTAATATDGGAPATVLLKVARLIDGVSAAPKEDQAILVAEGRIRLVGPRVAVEKQAPAATKVIDLGGATVLPGLIDAHTHVFLQGDATAADYD
jgi:imidazolonepropionase-like amidohydrolase